MSKIRILTAHQNKPEYTWRYSRCAYVLPDATNETIVELATGLHGVKGTFKERYTSAWNPEIDVMQVDVGDEHSEFVVYVNVPDDASWVQEILRQEQDEESNRCRIQPTYRVGPDGEPMM